MIRQRLLMFSEVLRLNNEALKLNIDTQNKSKPRLLTLKQAAALVEGLTEYRVRQLCINAEIKYHKFGNKYMISEFEILKYFGICA